MHMGAPPGEREANVSIRYISILTKKTCFFRRGPPPPIKLNYSYLEMWFELFLHLFYVVTTNGAKSMQRTRRALWTEEIMKKALEMVKEGVSQNLVAKT